MFLSGASAVRLPVLTESATDPSGITYYYAILARLIATDLSWQESTQYLGDFLPRRSDLPGSDALPVAEPMDLLLAVTTEEVRLTGSGTDVTAIHAGARPGLVEAVNEMRRSRARVTALGHDEEQARITDSEVSLSRAARLLAESFLPPPVATELARLLAAAGAAHQPVRLGLSVNAEAAWLPWEALPVPDGRGPLVLHPLGNLYRKTDAAPARVLPSPLRIVVAIAAPDTGDGPVLDYEQELLSLLAAVAVRPTGCCRREGGALRHAGGDPCRTGPSPSPRAAHPRIRFPGRPSP